MPEHAGRMRWRLRPLSVGVLAILVLASVGSCLFTRHVVADQEHKLLQQRTEEASVYLTSVIQQVQTELASITAAVAASNESPRQLFRDPKFLPALSGGFATVALIRTGPRPTVVATSGDPINGPLGSARLTAVRAAAAKSKLVGALVGTPKFTDASGARLLGFAYGSPSFPGEVVLAEVPVSLAAAGPTTSQPFSELTAAVYATPRADPDQLVAITGGGHTPLTGDTVSVESSVGAGPPWLLVTKARKPLVGAVAEATPWGLLGVGLVVALLATLMVETLARRREYAVGLVEVRTEELRESMSELAEAHEQLVRQERLAAIGQLASMIGHELRNPLAVMSNALFLLRSDFGPEPPDAAKRHLATAEREVSAATTIVSDLLEFAKDRQPAMSDVNMSDLVDEVLRVSPPPTAIEVRRELPEEQISVRADRDMLRQVLLNLVGNAYQAMADGGSVVVAVEPLDGALAISVTDTGVGMAEEVRDRVFEPFFTTKTRGVGLGLAVTKRIVEAHNGAIDVSTDPGHGTEFRLVLPRIAAPRTAGDAVVPAQTAPTGPTA
jgi:signal transduction histidine kinase